MTKKVGFIAGCFDIIHPGYIEMFEFSKSKCDYLIVGLHVDPTLENTNKLKPVLSIQDREKILMSIKFVDEVILYQTELDLENILSSNKIDLRFLGDDYVGKDYTAKNLDIPISWVSRSHGWSSTKLKEKIKKSFVS